MKLFVDDIRQAPDESWTVARNVTQAIRCIDRFSASLVEISLDHDISHQVVLGKLSRPYPCDECFCGVAYFIKSLNMANPDFYPNIIIHTANPAGADEMKKLLETFDCKVKMMGLANRLEMEV